MIGASAIGLRTAQLFASHGHALQVFGATASATVAAIADVYGRQHSGPDLFLDPAGLVTSERSIASSERKPQ